MPKVKRPVISAPQSLTQAADFLREIGKEQDRIDTIQVDLNCDIESMKKAATKRSEPSEKRIAQLFEGLFAFAQSRRNELTKNGKQKTVELPTGCFGWRFTPPAVSIKNAKAVIEKLKSLGLSQFIRIKEEPDKEAMLKESEVAKKVSGISISQHEEFFAKPSEAKVEITSRVDKLKKKLPQ